MKKDNIRRWAFFKDGILYSVSPRNNDISLYEDRGTAYKADLIVSDGIIYDLHNILSVRAIKIPVAKFDENVVFNLSYIMKIRCGVVDDAALIPTFVKKTLELMRCSKVGWRSRDYFQVLRNFYRFGLFDYGDAFEESFRALYPQLFNDLAIEEHEKEHRVTKDYYRRKWEKKHQG